MSGVTKFLARDLTFEINEDGSGDTWVEVKGLHSLTHAPNSTDADTTDFQSEGHDEHLKASRGDTWTISGFFFNASSTLIGSNIP